MTRATSTTIALMGAISLVGGQTAVAMPAVLSSSPVFFEHPIAPIDLTFGTDVSGLGSELAYGNLQAKIGQWTRLPFDWDGNDGEPLAPATANDVISMLAFLRACDIPCPVSYIAGDGEAGLRWQTPRGFASVSFLADRHLVALVRKTDGSAPIRVDEPFSDLLAIGDLIAEIKQVA